MDKPTCFVLDASGRMQAVFEALKQFISREFIYGVIAGSISSIQQRYGKDVDTNTIKSFIKADQVGTKVQCAKFYILMIISEE